MNFHGGIENHPTRNLYFIIVWNENRDRYFIRLWKVCNFGYSTLKEWAQYPTRI